MKYYACLLALTPALCASGADAQTFKTLVEFTGTGGTASGANPPGSLTLVGTTFYGVTTDGGTRGVGNVFSVGVGGGNYQNLVSFTGEFGVAGGAYPCGSLALGGTVLYGMTTVGGTIASGNIFSIGTGGMNAKNVFSFNGAMGSAYPYGSLTLAGATLYGMTLEGSYNGSAGGNIFSVSTDGTNSQRLVEFGGSNDAPESGMYPYGSLTIAGTTLYGMTSGGGYQGCGNVFSVGMDGANFQNLVSFTLDAGTAMGFQPHGSLTLAGSTLYGMTSEGGANEDGTIFSVGVNGTNFQNLVSFTGSGSSGTANGRNPYGSLILAGTTLYGMTGSGGTDGAGNVFSLGIDGSDYQNLYSFTGGTDGGYPSGDLTLSGGTLFGMASEGGINNNGTIFALTLPTPTPEPGTLALAGSAAAMLVAYRWRRRRAGWRAVAGGRMTKAACWKSKGTSRRVEGAGWRAKSRP